MKRVVFVLTFAFMVIFNQANATDYHVTVSDNSSDWAGHSSAQSGSLEWAIYQCNTNAGTHNILFDVTTVTLNGDATYSVLTRNGVTINGNTAPGYTAGNPTVVISGAAWIPLEIRSNSCTVTNVIFNVTQLYINGGSSNTVTSCLFDMNAAGNAAVASTSSASLLLNNTSSTVVGTSANPNSFGGGGTGHNVISITGTSTSNTITYNRIGTNKAGTAVLGAVQYALYANMTSGGFTFSNNTVRGAKMAVFCEAGLSTTGTVSNNTIVSPSLSAINIAAGGAASLTISNNTITSAGVSAIVLTGGSSTNISSNSIAGTGSNGIDILNANGVTITGNTVNSSSGGSPVYASGTTNNLTISSNNLGVQSTGVYAAGLGSFRSGICIESAVNTLLIDNNIVCGNGIEATTGVIPGAKHSGILLLPAQGLVISNATISNNYVGIDKSFNKGGNKFAGIYLWGNSGENNFSNITIQSNFVGDNGFSLSTNKRSHGIATLYANSNTAGNIKIYGNRVGLNDAGLNLGNWADGISILSSSGIQIGGTGANQPNYVGFNKGDNDPSLFPVSAGIIISLSSSNIQIIGNFVGVSKNGVDALPFTDLAGRSKTYGVIIEESSSNIQLGGTGATPQTSANTIKNSYNSGVLIRTSANTVTVRGNNISCNGKVGTGRGIDLSLAASPGNSSYGATTVAGTPYQEPVITSQASGTITGVGPANATIDIYEVSTTCTRACDLTTRPDKQEGAVWKATTTTDGTGAFSVASGLPAASSYVVTATDASGRTSEFSTCRSLCVTPTPVFPASLVTVCSGSGSRTFTITDATNQLTPPTTLTWTSTGLTVTAGGNGTGSPNNTSITVTVPIVATQTDYTISVLQNTQTGCQATATMTLRVNPTPAISGLPSTLTLCGGGTSNLSATVTGGTAPHTYSWANSNTGAGTLSSSSVANPTFTAATVSTQATTNLTLTVSDQATTPACSTSAVIAVTVNPTPTPTLTGASPICENTANTYTVSPAGGTYAWTTTGWTVNSGGTSGSNTVNATANIAAASTVSQNFTISVIQTINSCPSAPASITVHVDNTPAAAVAGPDQNICSATTATLAATAANIGTGTWTQTAGPASSITAANNPGSAVTGLAAGSPTNTYTYQWSIVNGACSSTPDDVNINVSTTPTPTLNGAGSVCENTSPNTYTVTGTIPTGSTFVWTTTGWASGTSTTSSINLTAPDIASTTTANQSLSVQVKVTAGACSTTVSIPVQIDNTPSAATPTAISSQCGATGVSLNTAAVGFGTGVWSQTAGNTATITPNSPSNTASVTGLTVTAPSTAYQFTWTVSNGVCTAASANVGFTNYSTVTGQPSTITICNATSTAVSANINPMIDGGTWTGSGSPSFSPSNTANTTVSGLTAGSNSTVTYTIDNGGFGSSSACYATSTISITNTTVAVSSPSGPSSSVCVTAPGTVSLTGNSTGAWSVANQPSGANAGFTNPTGGATDVTGLTLAGTYTFTWTVSGTCGTDAANVNVIVDAAAVAAAGNNIDACGIAGSVNLNATGTGSWSTASSVVVNNPTDPNSSLSNLSTGQFTFTWSVQNGACNATDDVTVTIDDVPVSAVDPFTPRCETNTSLVNIHATAGTGTWSVTSGTGTVTDVNNATTDITGVTAGTITVVTWTVPSTYNVCPAATSTVNVDIRVAPTADAGSDFSTCLTSTNVSANTTTAGTWTVISGTGTFGDIHDPTTTVSGLSSGSNVFEWTVSGGSVCADATSDIEITNTVADLDVTVTGDDDTLCVGSSRAATVTVTTGTGSGSYVYYWSDQDGNALFNTTDPIVSFTPSAGTTTYYVVVTDANQLGCSADIDSVKIVAVGEQNLKIPNLMTPNDDGANDVLLILDEQGKDILPGSYLQVVNRWGEQVYEDNSYRNTWKAPNTSDGMYFYYLKAGCGGRVYKGWVHILGNNKP